MNKLLLLKQLLTYGTHPKRWPKQQSSELAAFVSAPDDYHKRIQFEQEFDKLLDQEPNCVPELERTSYYRALNHELDVLSAFDKALVITKTKVAALVLAFGLGFGASALSPESMDDIDFMAQSIEEQDWL